MARYLQPTVEAVSDSGSDSDFTIVDAADPVDRASARRPPETKEETREKTSPDGEYKTTDSNDCAKENTKDVDASKSIEAAAQALPVLLHEPVRRPVLDDTARVLSAIRIRMRAVYKTTLEQGFSTHSDEKNEKNGDKAKAVAHAHARAYETARRVAVVLRLVGLVCLAFAGDGFSGEYGRVVPKIARALNEFFVVWAAYRTRFPRMPPADAAALYGVLAGECVSKCVGYAKHVWCTELPCGLHRDRSRVGPGPTWYKAAKDKMAAVSLSQQLRQCIATSPGCPRSPFFASIPILTAWTNAVADILPKFTESVNSVPEEDQKSTVRLYNQYASHVLSEPQFGKGSFTYGREEYYGARLGAFWERVVGKFGAVLA